MDTGYDRRKTAKWPCLDGDVGRQGSQSDSTPKVGYLLTLEYFTVRLDL